MGFSYAAAAAVIGVTVFLVIEISINSVLPALSDINDTYHDMKNRVIDEIQTDINITNVSQMSEYGGTWWDDNWLNRKSITLDSTKVLNTLDDFPVLIDVTDTDLKNDAQPDGDDITFIDSSNSIQYNHEIESYDSDTGHLIAWVNITRVTEAADTTIYMYYSNPTCDSQEHVVKTWDNNFHGVWHLAESSGNLGDSTGDWNNHTTIGGDPTYGATGKIDGSIDYDGAGDTSRCADDPSLDFGTGDFTIETWVKTQESNERTIIGKYYPDDDLGYTMKIKGGKLDAILADGASHDLTDGTRSINDNNWYHIVVAFDRSNDCTYYVNGASDQTTDISGFSGNTDNGRFFEFAQTRYVFPVAPLQFAGILDEARISNILRNSSWINTSYLNQNDPSDFTSFGDEEEKSLNITVKNTGSTYLDTSEFTVLINGTSNSFVSSSSFLNPENIAYLTVSLTQGGAKRVKVITYNGVGDYYEYTV